MPKLVRNKIPDIIRESGKTPIIRTASLEEAPSLLMKKMEEEMSEFFETPCLEEAADVYEVFMTLLQLYGLSYENVISAAVHKREARGKFNNLIVLEDVK